MISLACQIFSVQPHSACVLLQSSLCCALHVQTISSDWCGAPHLSPGCQALQEGSLKLTSSFALTLQIQRIMARSLRRRRFSVSTFMAQVSAACSMTLLTHDEYTLPLVRRGRWRYQLGYTQTYKWVQEKERATIPFHGLSIIGRGSQRITVMLLHLLSVSDVSWRSSANNI